MPTHHPFCWARGWVPALIASRAFIAIAALGVTASPGLALEWRPGMDPAALRGSFLKTCSSCQVDSSGRLTCTCSRENGIPRSTFLRLSSCGPNAAIHNHYGSLACRPPILAGSYVKTCKEFVAAEDSISAYCKNRNGQHIYTTAKVTGCPHMKFANDNGTMVCEAATAAPPAQAGLSDKDKAAAPIPKVSKGLTSPGGIAAAPSGFQADLAVTGLAGPGALKAGLSSSYTVAIKNTGKAAAAVELDIHFAGKLDQTGQITAGAGLACEVRPVKGVNSSVHCTGGRLDGDELTTVTVQGRGQEVGPGQVIATVNNSRAVKESDYNNNLKQLNVTIN